MISGRGARRVATTIRWLARVAGVLLLVRWVPHAPYEAMRFMEEQWSYGERLFSVGFLAMLLGLVVGWVNDKLAAALLIVGYLLAAGAPVVGTCSRPMLAEDALSLAVKLLPFLVIGTAYAYAGRRRPAFA